MPFACANSGIFIDICSCIKPKEVHILIHEVAPQSRLVVITIFTHITHSACLSVRPSVHRSWIPYVPLLFNISQNIEKQTSIATGRTVGLAEGIIDGPRVFYTLVLCCFVFPVVDPVHCVEQGKSYGERNPTNFINPHRSQPIFRHPVVLT